MYGRLYLLVILLASCGGEPPAEYQQALTHFARGEYPAALAQCQAVLRERPDFVECYRITASVAAIGGEVSPARSTSNNVKGACAGC